MSAVEESPAQPAMRTSHLIVHFVDSIQEVLRTMTGMSVEIGPPTLKKNPTPSYDVSGIIGLSGEFVGSMVLSFQQSTAQAIVNAFAGMAIAPDSADFPDAVGELANMIAGSAKTRFGGGTFISVPSIILGSGHTVARLNGVPCIVIPCHIAAGDFAVEVNIKPQFAAPLAPGAK